MTAGTIDYGLADLEPGRFVVEPRLVRSLEELEVALTALRGDGWVSVTDRVERWRGGLPAGVPLAGELAVDDVRTVHLRHGADGWLLVEIREEAGDGAVQGGSPCIEERCYPSTAPNDAFPDVGGLAPPFRYRIAYAPDEDGVLRPHAARFAGWKREG